MPRLGDADAFDPPGWLERMPADASGYLFGGRRPRHDPAFDSGGEEGRRSVGAVNPHAKDSFDSRFQRDVCNKMRLAKTVAATAKARKTVLVDSSSTAYCVSASSSTRASRSRW
jgi:hypothetical protein